MSFQDFAEEVKNESKFGKIKPTYIVGIAVILISIIAYLSFNLLFSESSSCGFSVNSNETTSSAANDDSKATASKIYVHVSGNVKNPGLIELESNDRVATAIEKAGGATEVADLNSINLAKKCEDGERIIVPSVNDSSSQSTNSSANSSSSTSTSSSNNGKVNINTADESGLQQISGIGPSKAKKIVEYRKQNGNFKSVEDLTNVSGIGEKTLASIKDQICV